MTRIVILGAGGFIGTNLVEALAQSPYQVLGIDRLPPRIEQPGVEWLTAEFQDVSSWADHLHPGDTVFHLVSTTLPGTSNDDPVFDVESNLIGTLRLLDSCRAKGVARVIYVSSGGTVYGEPHYSPIDELHPTNPQSSYGITKLAVEKYFELYGRLHGLNYLIFRLSNPYGRHQNPFGIQGAIGVFMRRALSGEPIEIWGDGSVVRDYVHIADVVDALLKGIAYSGPSLLCNLGSGKGTSLNEIVSQLRLLLGRELEVRFTPSRVVDVKANILSIDKIKAMLGWQPRTSLPEGLKSTMDYFSAHFKPTR